MARGRTVLVLGGGVGGVVAARRLRKRLPGSDRVVLIDRESKHLFQSSLLWVAVGERKQEQIQRPLARLARKGIEVITGDVTEFDPGTRSVQVNGTALTGDAVVVSLGAELAPELVPGLAQGGHNLYGLSGALAIRDALRQFQGGRVVVLTAAPTYKCPAAPYEAAMLINSHLRQRGVSNAVVEVFAAEAGPMGTAGPEMSTAVRGMVEGQGIAYSPNHQVTGVDPSAHTLHFANGNATNYDLLIYIPPHRAPAVVRDSGLAGESGWIQVNGQTMQTSVPNVFAIGDVTSIPIPSGKPLPKAGVFANREALIVAENLAAEWSGRTPGATFDGTGACFVEAGFGRAGYGSGNFYTSPMPEMRLHAPARRWHWGKVAYEKYWLHKWL